jgi:hypothetical protein
VTRPEPRPKGLENLWLPIGPTTVVGGQASGTPNVTGRVLEVNVSPDGRRVYAATAGGGVWYSGDEGASWLVLGAWFTTAKAEQLDSYANSLVAGSVVVEWDATPGGENDAVFVGTGETTPKRQGTPGSSLAGVGVLRAQNPVAIARANPFDSVWTREGEAIEGKGIYRLAMRSGHPDELVAATSGGLYVRAGAAASNNWVKLTTDPFDGDPVVTDAVWTATHLYVALLSRGVWRAGQPNGPFTEVELPDLQRGRISLASSADGSVVYALGEGPRLWRITGTTATLVGNVPAALFGSADNVAEENEEEREGGRVSGFPEHELPPEAAAYQGSYDIVVAVDPDQPNVIVLGGSAVDGDAALFKCTIQDPNGSPHLDYNPDNDKKGPANDPTFIGRGVHPDVHGLTFAKRGSTLDLWVGCDGGIFRSTHGGRSLTWQERNNGLAVIEAGYVACHPSSEAVVVLGTQDNGVLERIGDTTWEWKLAGDGGGVAFHPARGERYLAQGYLANWRSNDGMTTSPVWRRLPAKERYVREAEKTENDAANFYSTPGVVAATNGEHARIAVGTNRVWVSETFGVSVADSAAPTWFTVPTGNDPRGRPRPGDKLRADTGQDVAYNDARATTLVARWNGENELFVLNARSVQRYARAPGTGAWSRHAVTELPKKWSSYTESDIKKDGKMPYLPPLGGWSDLAIHQPSPEGKSTLYVACTSRPGEPKMDTLWWYDGVGTWHVTKLREAVTAPALAVAVHPTNSDTVFVGTTLGVWRGTFTPPPPGGDPEWEWEAFNQGLPEAAVHDLAFFRDPPSGAPTMLLLRAALQSRGVWEVDLLAPCDEKTYLRAHALDTRRRAVTPLADPMSAKRTPLDVLTSPDIVVRPAPPVSAATMPVTPPATFFPIAGWSHSVSFELWTFQTAFRQLEPACRPTGRWSDTFETLLVDYKKANGLGASPWVDVPTWTNVVTQARVYRAPWDGPVPTEADLLQLTRGEGNTVTPTELPARRLLVDVLVHHRGLEPLPAASVSVLLLLREMTKTGPPWTTLPISAAWKTATVDALSSGSVPAGGWPDNWAIADGTTPIRPPAAALDAAHPQVATFQLTFQPWAWRIYLLLAVCSSTTATITPARLAGATLGDLLVQSPHVAAHELELT